MARIVKEHVVRRTEILDAAYRLITTKGYERMTIQDILDELRISKGAFYHYFDTKQALLEALIDRMQQQMEQLLVPIVHDTTQSALERLQRFFAALFGWKTAQQQFFLALLRVWCADDNALVRQKVRAAAVQRFAPLLAVIIHQGIQEGVLKTAYFEELGEVVLSLGQSFAEKLANLLLASEPKENLLRCIEQSLAAYSGAIERVLGAPSDSLRIMDSETLGAWITLVD